MNENEYYELQSHEKSDKFKWIITGIAFFVVFVMLVGLCLQVFGAGKVKPSEWGKSSEETQVQESAFEVTPKNSTLAISLTSYSVADGYPDLAENERIIAVDTRLYSGDIDVSVAFVGKVIYWYGYDDDVEYVNPTDATNYIYVDRYTRSQREDVIEYIVTCLHPFGQQIEITFSFADFPDISASCVCDYTQTFEFSDVYIGFNSFMPDGRVGRQPILSNIMPVEVTVEEQGFFAGVNYYSSPYTVKSKNEPLNYPGLKFEFTVNPNWINTFNLSGYNFASYSGSFNNSLLVFFDHFFDITWLRTCIQGTRLEVDDFVRTLVNATTVVDTSTEWNETPSFVGGIDSMPAYTLTIIGLPEADGPCSYDVFLDIYNLVTYIEELDAE